MLSEVSEAIVRAERELGTDDWKTGNRLL